MSAGGGPTALRCCGKDPREETNTMPTDTMTTRERWNAALRMQPVDRLPFWAKLNASCLRVHGPRLGFKDVGELHRWVGSECFAGLGNGVKCIRSDTEERTTRDENDRRTTEYVTPVGALRSVFGFDEASASGHPIEFPIKKEEDLKVMTAWYEDTRYEMDPDAVEQMKERDKQIGQSACTNGGFGGTPIMHFTQHLAGIENAHYFLNDCPDLVEALFEAMHQDTLARGRLTMEVCPADCFFMGENTSTSLTSPEQYRRFCQRYLTEYVELVHEYDRSVVLHMCGFLKDILPDIRTVGAEAFEAFTTPPIGNTTFLDGRAACPDTCLIGGTNAALWLRPTEEIIEAIGRDLDELPHTRGIIPSSAGVMPPAASPEKIKAISDFVRSYPLRN